MKAATATPMVTHTGPERYPVCSSSESAPDRLDTVKLKSNAKGEGGGSGISCFVLGDGGYLGRMSGM